MAVGQITLLCSCPSFRHRNRPFDFRSAPPFVGTQDRLRVDVRPFVLSVARKGEVEARMPDQSLPRT